jgi:hypothetical protein
MKEAFGAARNLSLVYNDVKKTLAPMIETVIITTEPRYKVGETLTRVRVPESIRFLACPDVLRALAVQFATWADEADELAARYQHDVQGVATEDGSGDRGNVQPPGE